MISMPRYLAEAFDGKKAPLKAALLDQTLIAGLGNIYVCEALYRAGLSPTPQGRHAGQARARADPRLEDLARHIRRCSSEAIAAGGSTLRDYAQPDGSNGAFQQRFAVYDREGEPCPRCAKADHAASCRRAARPSIVHPARNSS